MGQEQRPGCSGHSSPISSGSSHLQVRVHRGSVLGLGECDEVGQSSERMETIFAVLGREDELG